MRTTRFFGIFCALFLVIVAGLSGLTFWNIDRSSHWDARVQLAQESYRTHLQLESHIYQLLKANGDALLIGERDGGESTAAMSAAISADIAKIRDTIAREIELVGDEEFEELEALALIERRVQALTRELSSFGPFTEDDDLAARQGRLRPLIDRNADRELADLIHAALEEEQEEVDETLAEAADFRATARIGLITLSLAACLLVVAFVISYMRLIRQPLEQLGHVLARLRRGEWAARSEIGGGREFRDLGAVLGEMATALAAREANRRTEAERLETMVQSRTEEQRRLLVQIERTENRRRQLLADISHELRTPLTIIQGEADVTLRGGDQPPEVYQDALARIRDSARHTNRIVDDLLLISRQEAGELRLDRKDVDVGPILLEAVEVFPGEVDLDLPETPVRAHVDRLRMRQCLLAVLQNARRYGGPNISASLALRNGDLQILVEDDGPGITNAEKEQAFDRFFRGNDASRGLEEGHGLGLPIVRSIVEAHGGRVWLEDATPNGLRVVMSIPTRPKPRIVPKDGADAAPASGGA